uniref:Uncharacterized protein n=1 Tax=Nephroselmis olivacea TaxID=31312 RepID=Q9T4H1_NEPOL|nr:hypothetical protein NeolCp086 [Nephroselmis olivacea]NP_050956.1 hypothetical protein NeolCp151 [Nephroselmis olivacea]AAD54862.1 unknown [Nephroselmis olivacea]AAD54927.1 unknown [Nephroselmis olivacea]
MSHQLFASDDSDQIIQASHLSRIAELLTPYTIVSFLENIDINLIFQEPNTRLLEQVVDLLENEYEEEMLFRAIEQSCMQNGELLADRLNSSQELPRPSHVKTS